jgi:hypothetical protein
MSNVARNDDQKSMVFDVKLTDTEWDNFAIRTGYHQLIGAMAPMLVSKVKGMEIKTVYPSDFINRNIEITGSMWDAPEDMEIEFNESAMLVLYPNPDDLSDSINTTIGVRITANLKAKTIANYVSWIEHMQEDGYVFKTADSVRELYDNITRGLPEYTEQNYYRQIAIDGYKFQGSDIIHCDSKTSYTG